MACEDIRLKLRLSLTSELADGLVEDIISDMEIPMNASISPNPNRSCAGVPNHAAWPVVHEPSKSLITTNSHEDASETKVPDVTPPISPAVKDIGLVSNSVADRGDVDSYEL